LLDVFT